VARDRQEKDYIQIKLRMKEALRLKLYDASQAVGRSLNDEGVTRLEQSFEDEEKIFKDQHHMALIRLLVGTIDLIEIRTGESWVDDDHTRSAVTAVIIALLNGKGGVPFNKPMIVDESGGLLSDDMFLRESPKDAITEAMAGLLNMHGVTDQTIEMIKRLIDTDANRYGKPSK
jgi:hypothetical protein